MGVYIDRTPKCHPEIAGEGIEYDWALAKLDYRKAPIHQKRTKEKSRNLLRDSSSHTTVLNIHRVRSCSKKARSYMKLYQALNEAQFDENLIKNRYEIMEGTMRMYSKLKNRAKLIGM